MSPSGLAAASGLAPGCQVHISRDAEHPGWNDFLERMPAGHHTQTSLWARAKAAVGWKTVRLIAIRGGRIVGGAQMLVRPVPLIGAVGYVPKGPVYAPGGPRGLAEVVLRELHRLAWADGLCGLVVQPPNDGHALSEHLVDSGFSPGQIQSTPPTATTLLDLSQDLETILRQRRPSDALQHSPRVAARYGDPRGDGSRCPRLSPHAGRLRATPGLFEPEPAAYIAELYRLLAPRGWLKLFIAEYQGEPVSAALALCFRDTAFYKRGGWSGLHGKPRPNEALQWEMIRWAKSEGYRYYDFEGIDRPVAEAVFKGISGPDGPHGEQLQTGIRRCRSPFS